MKEILELCERIFISGFATYVSYLGAEVIDPDNLPWGRLLVEETFRVSILVFEFLKDF